ncbi:18153_t:CDS:1, partial [Cetraspora pellucida]
DFSQEITAVTNVYVTILERPLDSKPLEKLKYKQQICIGNKALCPISVGKIVKVTTTFIITNDINLDDLIMLAYIGTPRGSDSD